MALLTLAEVKRLVELRSKKEGSKLNCVVLQEGGVRHYLENYKADEAGKQRLQIIYSVLIPPLEANGAPGFHWSAIDILFKENSGEAESLFFLDSVSIKWVKKVVEEVNLALPTVKNKYYAEGFQADDNSCSVFATTFCFDLAKISDLHVLLSRVKKESDVERNMWHIHKINFEDGMVALLRFTQSRSALSYFSDKFKDKKVNKKGMTFFGYVDAHDIKKLYPKKVGTSLGRLGLYIQNGVGIDNYAILCKYNKYKNEIKNSK
jgi:hypothetical protein